MSHVTHTVHDPAIHLPSSFLHSNNICWQVKFIKLYIMQFSPITFSHKSLRTEQSCSQTQCTVFLQRHKPSVTLKATKILHKHTHVYNSITSIQKVESTAKHYEAAIWISPIYFLSVFSSSNLHSLLPFQNTSNFPTLPKLQKMSQKGHVFMVRYPHCASRIYHRKKNLSLSMYNFTVAIINGSHMYQLQCSHL
jgi:hypothetical protein